MQYLLVFLILILFIYVIFKKNSPSFPNNYLMVGKFKKINGDPNQHPYFQNKIESNEVKIIYYNDSKKIINQAIKKNNQIIHKKSSSYIKYSLNKPDIYFEVTSGYADNKHGRLNVNYTATHTYIKVDDKIYYKNNYFFSNGDISSATYIKE